MARWSPLDEQGRQDFRGLIAGRRNLHYPVFDVLWLKGKDLREFSLSRRKRILSRLIEKTSTVLSPVLGVRGRGRDLFAAVERLDLEGIVVCGTRESALQKGKGRAAGAGEPAET